MGGRKKIYEKCPLWQLKYFLSAKMILFILLFSTTRKIFFKVLVLMINKIGKRNIYLMYMSKGVLRIDYNVLFCDHGRTKTSVYIKVTQTWS